MPGRHPRLRGRDPDPERGRVRPGGLRHDHRGRRLRPPHRRDRHRSRTPSAASPTATAASRPTPTASSCCGSASPWRTPAASPRPLKYAETARALGVEAGDRVPGRRSPARPCWSCAPARAWCSTPRTTTPGRPARSSPTRSSPRPSTPPSSARVAGPPRPRRRPARLPGGRGPDEDLRGLADRQGGLHQGLRQRPGPHLHQAHPRPHQPRRGHHRGPARAGPRGPRRRPRGLRRHPRQRTGDGRRQPLARPGRRARRPLGGPTRPARRRSPPAAAAARPAARAEPRTDCRASSASSASVKPWCCARDLVLRGQPRAEQQRVVRAQRHRHPGVEQRPQRYVLRLLVDPQRHVRRRAHLAGHPALGQPLQQPRVLGGPYAVPDPAGVQVVQAVPDARRARQLAAVRRRQQPALPGDGEGAVEVPGEARAVRRWRARSRRRRGPRSAPRAGPACGRPAGASSGSRRPGPACRARSRATALSTASRMISSAGISPPSRGAYEVGSTWISSQPRAVPRRPPRRPRAPAAGCPRAPAGRTARCRTAAGSGTSRARRWPAASAARRRVSASGRCTPYLSASSSRVAGPHRPGEVQVQMGLRQQTYVTYVLHPQDPAVRPGRR